MTQTTYSNTKNCYLIILDTESFTVYLENSGDSNDVYYSTDGGKPTSLFTSYALYSNKAVTLNYKQLASTTASTTYSISADDDNVHYNYQYFDFSHSSLVFSTGVTILEFPSPNSGGSSSGSFISMGLNSYSISSSTTCSIPIKTLIVFTQSDSIIGDAIVGSKSLSILGSSGIKAIAFLENGKLKLSSTSGTQTCKFIAYDYSKAEDYCTYVTILSGKVKYTLSPAGSYTYCIVSAFSEGQLKIETDEQNHYSYNVNNLMEYGQTSSDETVTSPVITYAGQYYTYSSTIKFDLSGSSSDESFVIDGSESKYDFYTISSTSSSQMNTGDAVGKASIGGLKPWAIALIVIFVIIAFIVIIVLICVCCCGKRCCCCSSSKVSASKEENNARPAQRESTSNNNNTAYPAQRISQSNNNNSAYPAQMASSSNNNSKARPVQRVEETNSTTIKVNVVNTTYIAPPPSQPPQPQQTQANYIPPPPQTPVYVAPPHQSVYGVPPQQPVYGAPPPVYGAPPQQPAAYIAPAPAPSYSAPETKDNYYNPYN